MGVIKPPWKDELFDQCPYNYCDHFGDKEILALICVICRDTKDDLKGFKEYYDSLTETTDDFTHVMKIVRSDTSKIKQKHLVYGAHTEIMVQKLRVIPATANEDLVKKAVDSLLHSEHYVSAKTRRAITSKQREVADRNDPSLFYLRSIFLSFSKLSLDLADLLHKCFFPECELVYTDFGAEEC